MTTPRISTPANGVHWLQRGLDQLQRGLDRLQRGLDRLLRALPRLPQLLAPNPQHTAMVLIPIRAAQRHSARRVQRRDPCNPSDWRSNRH